MNEAVRKEMVETPAETARRRHEAMTLHSAANPERDQSDTEALEDLFKKAAGQIL